MTDLKSSRIGLILAVSGAALSLTGCSSSIGMAQGKYTPEQKPIGKQLHDTMGCPDPAKEKYDPAELRALAAQPKKDPSRLMRLLGMAAARKDASFKNLPAQENLRHSDRGVALALLAYDYSVNDNRKALEILLWNLKKEPQGGDSATVAALGAVDEWQRSPAAVKRFFQRTDGAGTLSQAYFWGLREFYFPEHYREYQKKEKH